MANGVNDGGGGVASGSARQSHAVPVVRLVPFTHHGGGSRAAGTASTFAGGVRDRWQGSETAFRPHSSASADDGSGGDGTDSESSCRTPSSAVDDSSLLEEEDVAFLLPPAHRHTLGGVSSSNGGSSSSHHAGGSAGSVAVHAH